MFVPCLTPEMKTKGFRKKRVESEIDHVKLETGSKSKEIIKYYIS